MKKIVSFIVSMVMVISTVSQIAVFADGEVQNAEVSVSEAKLIKNTSGTLSAVSASSVSNMAGSGVSASAYKITDVLGTATTDKQRLYLRFDLSDYTLWNVSSATLSFNIKSTANTYASGVKIYKADAVSGALADIPTTYAENVSGLMSIATESNLIDSFTVRGNGSGATYATTNGITAERTISDYICGRLIAGYDTATILFEFEAGADNTAYNAFIASETTAYAPKLTISGKEKETHQVNIMTSSVASIQNASGTLSSLSAVANAANMAGSGVSAHAYSLTDVAAGHTKTTNKKRLYLRFDLSDYLAWIPVSAILSFNIKNTNTGSTSTVKIYKADAITEDLSSIPTAYSSNVAGLEGIAAAGNLIDSFTVKGNGTTATYTCNPGLTASRTISDYIKERISGGYSTATILFEFEAGADNSGYSAAIASETTDYAPKITLTGVPSVKYERTNAIDPNRGLIAVDKTTGAISMADIEEAEFNMAENNENAYRLTDALSEHTATDPIQTLFLQFDISGVASTFSKAELSLFVKNTNTGKSSNVKIYKADGITGTPSSLASNYENVSDLIGSGKPVDTTDAAKLLKTVTVRSTYTGHLWGKEEVTDITSYIQERKSVSATTATIMIQFEAGADNALYVAYIGADGAYAPSLNITQNGLTTSGTSSAGDIINGTLVSYEDSDSKYVTPYIAVYTKVGSVWSLESCGVGTRTVLDGTGQKMNARLIMPAGLDYSSLITKFFLFADDLTPYYFNNSN